MNEPLRYCSSLLQNCISKTCIIKLIYFTKLRTLYVYLKYAIAASCLFSWHKLIKFAKQFLEFVKQTEILKHKPKLKKKF